MIFRKNGGFRWKYLSIWRRKPHLFFAAKRPEYIAAKPHLLKQRMEALSIPRRRRGRTFFCGQRPRFFLLPRGRAPSPPFSFCRKKRTGRWSGPREKTPGAPRLNVLHEARKGPWIPPCWVRALPASRVGVSGVLFGFRRGRRHQTPDDFSLVPPGGTISFSKKEMVGPEAPLLEGMRSAAFGRKDGLSRARGADCLALGSAFERSAPSGRKDRLGRAARGKKPPRRRKPAGRFSTFPKRIVEKSFTGDT